MSRSEIPEKERPRPDESFLQRFSRRKLEARGLAPTAPEHAVGESSPPTMPHSRLLHHSPKH